MTSEIIARATYDAVADAFQHSDSGRPCIRIKDLQPSEIASLLSVWKEQAGNSGLDQIRVVVARDGNDYPPEFLADRDKSITFYRNHNDSGLLYIQTQVQSDEQGLESMFTIRDRNFLDGSLDTAASRPGRQWFALLGRALETWMGQVRL